MRCIGLRKVGHFNLQSTYNARADPSPGLTPLRADPSPKDWRELCLPGFKFEGCKQIFIGVRFGTGSFPKILQLPELKQFEF